MSLGNWAIYQGIWRSTLTRATRVDAWKNDPALREVGDAKYPEISVSEPSYTS